MQAAQLPDQLMPRPQIKMVGIRKNNLHTELFRQIPLLQALDCGLRANRHEDRRFDRPMRRMQQPCSRAGMGAFRHNFEADPVQVRL